MRPLSPTDAISPALERTKDLLFRPVRWRHLFKLATVAFFAEIGGGFGLNVPGRAANFPASTPVIKATLVTIFLFAGLALFVVGLILLYVSSRLQLVLVGIVATRHTQVAPHWRQFSRLTWRWIGLKLLVLIPSVGLGGLVALPFILNLMRHPPDPASPPGLSFFAHILLFFAILFPLVLLISAVYMLLRDLALPFFALEDLSISQTWGRLRAIISAEPGQVALYVLLRVLIAFMLALIAEIAIFFALLLSLLPFGIVGAILWFSLHNAGTAGYAALIGCAIAAGLLLFAWLIFVVITIFGVTFVFLQAYALFFLGGRYPLLGQILEPILPPTPPPPLLGSGTSDPGIGLIMPLSDPTAT